PSAIIFKASRSATSLTLELTLTPTTPTYSSAGQISFLLRRSTSSLNEITASAQGLSRIVGINRCEPAHNACAVLVVRRGGQSTITTSNASLIALVCNTSARL